MTGEKSIHEGCIVRVDQLLDLQRRNPKNRRCIVLKRVSNGTLLLLVATTGEYDQDSRLDDEFELPSGNPQQPSVFGFTKPTVAKCTWLAIVKETDCERTKGPIETARLNAIYHIVNKMVSENRHTIVRDDR